MATPNTQPKSASEVLAEKLESLVEHAAERMTPEEFDKARAGAKRIIDAVRARAERRQKA